MYIAEKFAERNSCFFCWFIFIEHTFELCILCKIKSKEDKLCIALIKKCAIDDIQKIVGCKLRGRKTFLAFMRDFLRIKKPGKHNYKRSHIASNFFARYGNTIFSSVSESFQGGFMIKIPHCDNAVFACSGSIEKR